LSLYEALSVDKPGRNLHCRGTNSYEAWKCWFILQNM